MLIHHDEKGMIDLVQSDPGPEPLANLLGLTGYIHIEGEILPEIPLFDLNGEPFVTEGRQLIQSPGIAFPDISKETHYVDLHTKEIIERPYIGAEPSYEIKADDKDAFIIEGFPDPVTIKLDGEEVEIVGGILEFTTAIPGTYTLEFIFPCQECTTRIIAK